jgi:enoyl-CoA hydratase
MNIRTVLLDRPADGVAVVTLSRPEKYNALLPEMLQLLADCLRECAADPKIRAVVLTGAGKAFCAGLDLGAVGEGADFGGGTHLEPLHRSPKPVVGAINGVAITGGLELALACDFRIGSTDARFADTHSRVGITPYWGLTARLPQTVGQGWARRMSFTGDFVDAATALRIGLLTEVTAPDGLLPRAVELAASIATCDASTLARIRDIYNESRGSSGRAALEAEARFFAEGLTLADPAAFAARRDATFARGKAQQ